MKRILFFIGLLFCLSVSAQQVVIRYNDLVGRKYPLSVTSEMFSNIEASEIIFSDTTTYNYLYRLFKTQNNNSFNLPSDRPDVRRQIVLYESGIPLYILSYDNFRMELNGKTIPFNQFIYNVFEKIIDLNKEKGDTSHILPSQESISDYHSGQRYPLLETLIQEQTEQYFSKNDFEFNLGLGHTREGKIVASIMISYDSSQNATVNDLKICYIDTLVHKNSTVTQYSRIYPTYSGPMVISIDSYIILCDSYFFVAASTGFSKKNNSYMVTLTPPTIEVSPSFLSFAQENLKAKISLPFLFHPHFEEMPLQFPHTIEYLVRIPCILY